MKYSTICMLFIGVLLLNAKLMALNIKGKILDYDSRIPVISAKVQLFDGLKHLTTACSVNIDGTFSLLLNDFTGSHFTVKVIAKKYYNYSKTVVVNTGEFDLGEISIKPLPSVKLSKLSLHRSSDSLSSNADFIIQNQAAEKMIIKSISINGNKLNNSSCLDASPQLTIDIHDSLKKQEAIIQEKGEKNVEKIAITGKIEMLPCNQIRLHYLIKYQFLIDASESFKIRIKIPAKVLYKKSYSNIDIVNWAFISVNLELEDGTIIQSQL